MSTVQRHEVSNCLLYTHKHTPHHHPNPETPPVTQPLHLRHSIAEVALVCVGNSVGAADGCVLHGADSHMAVSGFHMAGTVNLKQSQNIILISTTLCISPL